MVREAVLVSITERSGLKLLSRESPMEMSNEPCIQGRGREREREVREGGRERGREREGGREGGRE